MKRFYSVVAGICTLGAAVLQSGLAETLKLPYFPNGMVTFESALSSEELQREAFMNMRSDADMLKSGPAKEDAKGKANISIFGSIVNNNNTPLCALVLANGQFMFSCSPNGTWSLVVPQDAAGQVTLFGFADNHFPYRLVTPSSGGRYDMILNVAGTTNPPPPPPPDPPVNHTITFTITDGCNNGISINYKFYDVDNNLVWPSATTHYATQFYNASYTHNLLCRAGARVCYGARSANYYWGVDVDRSKSCTDCCIFCQAGNSLSRRLTC